MLKYIYKLILILTLSLFSSCDDFISDPGSVNTPLNNFDIMWHEFDLYYPSFIVKNINWDSLKNVYRLRINDNTSNDGLWGIMTSMLWNFNDIHVSLYNNDGTDFFNSSHNKLTYDYSIDVIKNNYLTNGYTTSTSDIFTYGVLPGDSIGYLNIKSFHSSEEDFNELNKVMLGFSNLDYLIIDIRDNLGGIMPNVVTAASIFVNEPITFRQEISRNGTNHSDFTAPFYQTISPNLFNTVFNKRTIILTNRSTASASEIFALLFKCLPNSIQIGDSTAGGLGTVRGFQLPNGWLFKMPVCLSLTIEGECLEEKGVIPDICIKNTIEEILNGYDHVLEFAISNCSSKK